MKDMAAMQPGMDFYSEMPDSYNIIVNTEHPLIIKIKENAENEIADKVNPILDAIETDNNTISTIRSAAKDGKLSDDDNKAIADIEKQIADNRNSQKEIIAQYAISQPTVKQLIDLALLGNGLLKGEELSKFIKRSVELL